MASSSTLRARTVAAVVVAVALTACSLLVNKDKNQCSSSRDCGSGASCVDGVCVIGSGGLDGSNDAPGDGPATGDAGCAPKAPVTQDDFLNEKYTNAECIPFDNCARVGLCPGVDGGDGGLPALVSPPPGGV